MHLLIRIMASTLKMLMLSKKFVISIISSVNNLMLLNRADGLKLIFQS